MEKFSLCDLKNKTLEEAEQLCGEIREYLMENVVVTGGHLASNLGITEISVALLRTFSPPEDNIIYDTGHQSYVHKLLTGRKHSFSTLRTYGGLSGFTKRSESIYDPFGAGHCSTSISAAIGMARADAMSGKTKGKSIAVIGDGAFSGGLVYEALNNIKKDDRIIIILNDNEMSISKNVGLMAGYLNKIRATENYYDIKHKSEEIISSIPIVGASGAKAISKVKNRIKTVILKNNLFEQLGIYYLGPADGNDLKTTEALLREAKRIDRPVLVHLHTKKGKGFLPAENDPSSYHSVKADSGKNKNYCTEVKTARKPSVTFTDNFGKIIVAGAAKNNKITAVTAAMCDGVGLNLFEKKFPKRFFDVGIAEEHGMTFTAGMAAGGALPVFALYSTFFQRAYDQIFHDLALQDLKAVIALDRCGLVGEDGPTHHGLFDVAISLPIPNVSVYSPATLSDQVYSFKNVLKPSEEEKNTYVSIIRYPKGTQDSDTAEIFNLPQDISLYSPYPYGEVEAVIITYGRITAEAVKAVKMCRVKCAVVKVLKLKPFDFGKLYNILEDFSALKAVVFLEEGIKNGGFSQFVLSKAAEDGKLYGVRESSYYPIKTNIIAIDDVFVPQGKVSELLCHCGLDSESILAKIEKML